MSQHEQFRQSKVIVNICEVGGIRLDIATACHEDLYSYDVECVLPKKCRSARQAFVIPALGTSWSMFAYRAGATDKHKGAEQSSKGANCPPNLLYPLAHVIE